MLNGAFEMKKYHVLIIILGFCTFITACSRSQMNEELQKVELVISAAASLTDALTEMERAFSEIHPEIRLVFNFGGSGKLKQQIEQGAPVDVFLSASQEDMRALQQQQLILEESLVNLASNSLVLIAHQQSDVPISSFSDLENAQISQVAIGDPETVPAGRYAKESLLHLQIWDHLKNHFVYASDVRQVLTYVASQNVDVGIVYRSDAIRSEQVRMLATANSNWHEPIMYPGAIVANSSNPQEAMEFLAFIMSARGQEILQVHGFGNSQEEAS